MLLVLEAIAKALLVVFVILTAEGIIHLDMHISHKWLTLCFAVNIAQLAADASVCGVDQISPTYLYMLDWYFLCSSPLQSSLICHHRTIPFAFGVLLLGLALYKAIPLWKENGYHGSRLISILIKDQILYFVL